MDRQSDEQPLPVDDSQLWMAPHRIVPPARHTSASGYRSSLPALRAAGPGRRSPRPPRPPSAMICYSENPLRFVCPPFLQGRAPINVGRKSGAWVTGKKTVKCREAPENDIYCNCEFPNDLIAFSKQIPRSPGVFVHCEEDEEEDVEAQMPGLTFPQLYFQYCGDRLHIAPRHPEAALSIKEIAGERSVPIGPCGPCIFGIFEIRSGRNSERQDEA